MARSVCLLVLLAMSTATLAEVQYDVIDLGTLGGDVSRAWSINAQGQVVGQSQLPSGVLQAFIWDATNGMQQLNGYSDSYSSMARDINDNGLVVGYSEDGTRRHGVAWDPTTGMVVLSDFGYDGGAAMAVNNNGVIVGNAGYDADGNGSAAWWERKAHSWTILNGVETSSFSLGLISEDPGCEATDVNNGSNYVVAVNRRPSSFAPNAFRWSSVTGSYSWAGTFPIATATFSINDIGLLVGTAYTGQYDWASSRAEVYDDADLATPSVHLADHPDYAYDVALKINNQNQIVGYASETLYSNGHPTAFLLEWGRVALLWEYDAVTKQSTVTNLNDVINPNSGWVLEGATAINEDGWIVGYGRIDGSDHHAFLLKPKSAAIAGDANHDNMVDVGDLGILAANYGTASGATWEQGDFNADGAVDVGDLGILAANYGTGVNAAVDFNADYAKAFGTTAVDNDSEANSTLCSGLGLPLIAGLLLAGLMFVKLEE